MRAVAVLALLCAFAALATSQDADGTWTKVYENKFAREKADLQSWVCKKANNKEECKTYGCSAVGTLLGGQQNFGKGWAATTNVDGLVSHNRIRVQFDFVQFGPWTASTAELSVDGAKVWSMRSEGLESGSGVCSNSNAVKEKITKVVQEIQHINQKAEIVVYGDINADGSYWGITNVVVSVYTPPLSDIGGVCNPGRKCKEGAVPVMCLNGRCVEQCVSPDDPRANGRCLWQDGSVPLGRKCQASSNCASKTCQGEKCVEQCAAIKCQNGFACANGVCQCSNGFTGDYCEIKPDKCAGIVCNNGGICVAGQCSCNGGFTGDRCQNLPVPQDSPGTKKLEGITEILMKKMEQQSAVLVQRLEAMQKQMSGVQGALVTQMAAKAREDITTKLEDSKTLFANTFQRIKAKGTMIKQSLDAVKRLLQDDNDGSKREQQLMDAIRRKSKAAAAVAAVAQEAKVEKKMVEQVKKTTLASKQQTQKNSLEILPNRQPPAPPRPADAIKKAPEPIIPPLEQPSDPAPERDLSQIYNGIPTVNVPVIGRNELLGGINVIGQHDETMTQLHGLTTDVEMKE
jgi:hypothetical protein